MTLRGVALRCFDNVNYVYDALGRQSQLQVKRDASNTFTTTYGYDALSRLTSVNSVKRREELTH